MCLWKRRREGGGRLSLPSASIVVKNIYLFSPRGGLNHYGLEHYENTPIQIF